MRVIAIIVAVAAFLLAAVLIFGGSQQWGIGEVVGVISAIVGIVGLYLSFSSQHQQRELEHDRASQQQAFEEQHSQDAALQNYFEQMRSLLTEQNLVTTKRHDIRSLARTQTLTVLSRLDASRKRDLLFFLYHAGLIGGVDDTIASDRAKLMESILHGSPPPASKKQAIVDLKDANFSGADLRNGNFHHVALDGANLRGANLSGANLSGAGLGRADLSGADLSGADLSGAGLVACRLVNADLRGAALRDARLGLAKLSGADLSGADLSGADLRHANLRGANGLTSESLSGANLASAIMPNGTRHPDPLDN